MASTRVKKSEDLVGQGRYISYTVSNMPATPLAFGNAYLWWAFFIAIMRVK
jgi:hypothetical protein